ncbi:hypothetical protein QA943_06555 [Streptomyces sp. B21-097]|uniref:hypothetical protein n=1 Tax=Streptomyces sp. B21-097 TaxID=3039414 RepID=UPI002FF31A35
MLRTAAEREEAAALVQDRQRWLTLHGLPVPARADIPLPVVRAETLARHALDAEPLAALLRRLTDTGWDVCGSGPGRDGDRVARLELPAEPRPGLSALISCQVHAPQQASGDRSNA